MAKEIRRKLEREVARVQVVQRVEPDYVRDHGKRILHTVKGEFLQLAALQEAVEGGFALPNYDHYKQRFCTTAEDETTEPGAAAASIMPPKVKKMFQ